MAGFRYDFEEWRVGQADNHNRNNNRCKHKQYFVMGSFASPRLISLFSLLFTTWPRNWLTHIFLLAVKLLYLLGETPPRRVLASCFALLLPRPKIPIRAMPPGRATLYLCCNSLCVWQSVGYCSLKNTCAARGYWISQTRLAGGRDIHTQVIK